MGNAFLEVAGKAALGEAKSAGSLGSGSFWSFKSAAWKWKLLERPKLPKLPKLGETKSSAGSKSDLSSGQQGRWCPRGGLLNALDNWLGEAPANLDAIACIA